MKNKSQAERRANKRLILRPAKLRWRTYVHAYIKEYNYARTKGTETPLFDWRPAA